MPLLRETTTVLRKLCSDDLAAVSEEELEERRTASVEGVEEQ
jgi:hypothetical protein